MRILKYFAIGIYSALAVLLLLAAYYITPIWSKLPSGAELRQLSETVEMPLDEMPDHAHLAFLAAEQPDFLTEGPNAINCVITLLVKGSNERNCGSTIPQLVTRNILRTKSRSIRHPNWHTRYFIMVVKVEYYLTPEQILELALNRTYLGRNTYGIAQAAQLYFAKTPATLTLAQSALLAGLIKAPSRYNPIGQPERALDRRNIILDLMVKHNMITKAEGIAAIAEPLGLK